VQVALNAGAVAAIGISTNASTAAPSNGGAIGILTSGSTNVMGQNAFGVSASASNSNTVSGTAYGVFARAGIGHCGPLTPNNPTNYAIGLYGVASSPGGCPNQNWALYADGRTFTPGGLWTASDERLKTDIRDFSSALNIISNLQPKIYQFTTIERYAATHLPTGIQYGFLAQDVEKVLPGAVTDAPLFLHNKGDDNAGDAENIKAINYTMLIPVLTQAIKEQQQMIEELRTEVSELKKGRISASPVGARLYQNQPNPFNSNTVIRYSLPNTVKQASIVVFDMQGKQVKQININSGAGQVMLQAGDLSAGTYLYTLVADGIEADKKKMVLTKE
jgi:hypothetical protein